MIFFSFHFFGVNELAFICYMFLSVFICCLFLALKQTIPKVYIGFVIVLCRRYCLCNT